MFYLFLYSLISPFELVGFWKDSRFSLYTFIFQEYRFTFACQVAFWCNWTVLARLVARFEFEFIAFATRSAWMSLLKNAPHKTGENVSNKRDLWSFKCSNSGKSRADHFRSLPVVLSWHVITFALNQCDSMRFESFKKLCLKTNFIFKSNRISGANRRQCLTTRRSRSKSSSSATGAWENRRWFSVLRRASSPKTTKRQSASTFSKRKTELYIEIWKVWNYIKMSFEKF